MKRISAYFFLLCMALTVVSCVEPLAPQPGLRDGAFGINLSVVCKSPDTKAPKPGEDQYNENALNRIDWFVFKDGTEAAIAHGRIIGSNGVVASTTVSLDEFADPASGISGKVYVIANLPATRFKHDDAKGILQSTDGGTTWGTDGALTRKALEVLEVVASFDALDAGKFKKQDEFVMRGETTFALTPAATTQTVTAPLDRLAAKVTMQLSVVPAIDEIITMPNGDYLYTKTWYPELDKINVYLSYADNHATIAATPEDSEDSQAQSSGFFTYNRYAYKTLYSYTGAASSPSATFPSTVTPHWDEDWFWQVTGSPFYTYPIEWKTSSSTAPFIKVILPWTSYDESAGIVAPDGHFVRAGRAKDSSKKGKTQEFYYKIALPSENTTDDKKLQLLCNEWYDLILDVSILGGPSDDLPLELAGQYYVVDWSNPDFTAGGALKQGRYLSVARDTFYIYGGNSIEIPVQSSHDITVGNTATRVTAAAWTDFYNNGSNTPKDYSGNTGLNALTHAPSITADGRVSITFTHEMMTDISQATTTNKPDVSQFTFKVVIANSAGLTKSITIIQQPPLFINYKTSNHYVFVNKYGGQTQNVSAWDDYYNNYPPRYDDYQAYSFSSWWMNNTHRDHFLGNVVTRNANLDSGNSNPNNYNIFVSSLTGLDYVIGDPRVDTGTTLNNLDGLTNYKQTKRTNANNMISPAFKIASSYGMCVVFSNRDTGGPTYENAVKRCAAYQENGYPAGRWRVPTEAEISFVITLSQLKVIPPLFAGEYWASSGRYYSTSTNSFLESTNNKQGPVRCVYDTWYWGDTQDLAHLTTWGGFQTDNN